MFTCNQINEIRKKLSLLGAKDTQFPEASKLDGNEIVVIVQNGENRKTTISTIVGLLSGVSVDSNEDFINISRSNTGNLTLATAVTKVDLHNRNIGQVITFKESDGVWATYQFTGNSLDNWTNISLWKNITGSGDIDLNALEEAVNTNTGNITTLQTSLNNHKSDYNNSIAELNNKIALNKTASDTNAEDIEALSQEIDTNTANIASNSTNINKISTKISSQIEPELDNHETRLSSLESSKIQVDTTVTPTSNNPVSSKGIYNSIQNSINNYDTQVQASISSVETSIANVETALGDITNKIKVLSKSEYEALQNKDTNTVYFLRE